MPRRNGQNIRRVNGWLFVISQRASPAEGSRSPAEIRFASGKWVHRQDWAAPDGKPESTGNSCAAPRHSYASPIGRRWRCRDDRRYPHGAFEIGRSDGNEEPVRWLPSRRARVAELARLLQLLAEIALIFGVPQ